MAVPTAASWSWLRKELTRLNPFSPAPFDGDPARVAYWRRTRGAVARQSLVFLVATHG
jgi:hypothetical protein